MTSPIVETDLGKVLEQINHNLAEFRKETNQNLNEFRKETNQRFDKIDERLTNLEIGQARLEERLTAVEKDVTELKGTTKNQLWSLIVLLAGMLLTIGAKVFIFPNSP